jgi:selenocysteine lyase/cysteine desulfurase
MCSSVVAAIEAAGASWRSYPVDEQLDPVHDRLKGLISPQTEAVLVPRYFGFPSLRLGEIRDLCSQRGIALVEDMVGCAIPLGNVDSVIVGDFAFNSLRKFCGLPEGAEVLGLSTQEVNEPTASDEQLIHNVVEAKRALPGARRQREDRAIVSELDRWERELSAESGTRRATQMTRSMIDQVDFAAIAEARRENYSALYSLIMNSSAARLVHPIFPSDRISVAPLCLPVVVSGDRDDLRSFLAARGVFAPAYWPRTNQAHLGSDPQADRLYESLLGLPIDQRLVKQDLLYLVELLELYASAKR